MENKIVHSKEQCCEGGTYNSQFEIMWDHFAVAMAKIVLDEELTLLCGNEAFFAMTGYSKIEFHELFHNKTKPFIVSEDFDRVFLDMNKKKMIGESVKLHLRIKVKDQSVKWLSFKAKCSEECFGEKQHVFYCVLNDITESKTLQKQLEMEEERYRLISEISDDITFEYDVANDIMYYGKRYEELFHKDPTVYEYRQKAIKETLVEKGSMESFLAIFRMRKKENAKYYTEIQINGISDKMEWYGVHYTGIFDEDNHLCKLIGKLINIDKQVKEKEYLLKQSQVDPMTKLFNKVTAEKEISQHLNNADEYSLGAMLIIDVDDFKSINDTLGHLFGDAVLKDIAKHIKKIFRTKDVTGRIGGDEFIIFMKDISSKQVVYEKAKCLCEGIVGLYNNSTWSAGLSISIGVAMQEGEDHSYAELFQNADIALYHAKEKGKNRFEVFQDHADENCYLNLEAKEQEVRPLAVTEGIKTDHNELIKLSLTALNSSKDFATRITRILELIGKSMNVCKVLLGVLDESENMKYSYQWMRTDKEKATKLTVSVDLVEFANLFDAEGIFYCNDTDSLTEKNKEYLGALYAKSLLQFAIIYQGKLIGTLGVQSCIEKRLWVDSEIESLQIISQILTGYLA